MVESPDNLSAVDDSVEIHDPEPSFLRKTGSFFLEILQMVVVTFVLYFAIDAFIDRVQVESISMLDTVKPGELLMVWKQAYRNEENFQYGDIVVFHAPNEPGEDYIKRLIGLPGDTVTVADQKVFVNGELFNEPYIKEPPYYSGSWEVPEGYLFVLGDNRNMSGDSHEWGFLPIENVFGRAFFIYWPIYEIGTLPRFDPLSAAP